MKVSVTVIFGRLSEGVYLYSIINLTRWRNKWFISYTLIETKIGVGQYLARTNSVVNSVRSTSIRRWYGANRDLIPL